MILRLSTPAVRGLLVLAALALAAGLTDSGVRNAFGEHDAGLNTPQGLERAAQLEPDDASNWSLLGRYWQYNLEDPDVQRAIRAYQKALTIDPHSADTWLDLGTAYESKGDITDARNAFLHAKRVYPISPEVSWRYGNFLLRQGDVDGAFAQIKQTVDVDPKRGAAAFSLGLRVDPDIRSVLDRVLPRSQAAYLAVISSLTEQGRTDQALVVWSRLDLLHPQFPLSESYPLMESLIHKRQMTEARRVWDQALAFAGVQQPPDPPGSLVWDGGFESDVANGGLAWRYAPFIGGVRINLDSDEKHSGRRSLRLTFNGLKNVDFGDVCQYIPVQPAASYLFSAWIQTRNLSTDQGVRFGLHSISDSDRSVAWTDDVRGTQPWTQIRHRWTAGLDVRELQLCVSRQASTQSDDKISGSAWIDDVALVPESAENTKQ
ncbi:MAG TPA: tetratricopeptide repeat protein [Candidatus Solibacter sp.]|nr:tetratricopeptide repeat protein [Candidatus Solibacter sp.]